jgi:hypothetical protein
MVTTSPHRRSPLQQNPLNESVGSPLKNAVVAIARPPHQAELQQLRENHRPVKVLMGFVGVRGVSTPGYDVVHALAESLQIYHLRGALGMPQQFLAHYIPPKPVADTAVEHHQAIKTFADM